MKVAARRDRADLWKAFPMRRLGCDVFRRAQEAYEAPILQEFHELERADSEQEVRSERHGALDAATSLYRAGHSRCDFDHHRARNVEIRHRTAQVGDERI